MLGDCGHPSDEADVQLAVSLLFEDSFMSVVHASLQLHNQSKYSNYF